MAETRGGTSPLAASVGLTDADLIAMYRTVALARAIDERMWILNRAGRIPFVISGQGHEGAQVGIAWALERGKDWITPFYRSIGTCLAFGMTARDIMLAQYAKASDPSSGGRQMPGHYGHHSHNLLSLSSPVATQILHAVGIALAAKIRGTGQVAMCTMGEGSSNQGDVHEALNFAGIHKLPFIFTVENNGYAISVPSSKELALEDVAARASGYGIPGVIVDGSDVLACYAAAREAVDARPARRRVDAHRGQGHPPDRPLVGRPADEVPLRGGAGRHQASRPAPAVPRPASRRRSPDRGAARRRSRRTSSARWKTRPTMPRPSRTPTRRPRCAGSSPRTGRPRRRQPGASAAPAPITDGHA